MDPSSRGNFEMSPVKARGEGESCYPFHEPFSQIVYELFTSCYSANNKSDTSTLGKRSIKFSFERSIVLSSLVLRKATTRSREKSARKFFL